VLLAAGEYLLTHLSADFGRLAERVMRAIELDPQHGFLHRIVDYLHNVHASELKVVAVFALVYGVVEIVEGAGLWLDKLWAEFLTVGSTSLLLPYEFYELVRKPTAFKAGGILVNIAIVVYLVVVLRRRLERERAVRRLRDAGA
jgi:uncharacterized membrane protein (DUF2068 family)